MPNKTHKKNTEFGEERGNGREDLNDDSRPINQSAVFYFGQASNKHLIILIILRSIFVPSARPKI